MQRYVSPGSLAAWLTGAFIVLLLVQSLAVFSDIVEVELLTAIASGAYYTWTEIESNDIRQAVIGSMQFLVTILTGVLFLLWIHRCYKNTQVFGCHGLNFTPGWAVGWFFVPILNMVQPFRVIREIWKGSDPSIGNAHSWQNAPSTTLLPVWWAFFVIGAVAGLGLFAYIHVQFAEVTYYLAGAWTRLVLDAWDVPAIILTILLVRRITARQDRKYHSLLPDMAGADVDSSTAVAA